MHTFCIYACVHICTEASVTALLMTIKRKDAMENYVAQFYIIMAKLSKSLKKERALREQLGPIRTVC